MAHYELVNERYGGQRESVTINELTNLMTVVFGDTETELVERTDGIYERGTGELVAELVED